MNLLTLQAIATRTWGKKDEQNALKAEPDTLDQKITAKLAPKQEKQDFGEDVKLDKPTQRVNGAGTPSQSINSKESMVAEPIIKYNMSIMSRRAASI